MTIKSSGTQLAFTEIEAEFGDNPERSLGQYRREDPSRVSSSNPNGLLNNSSPVDKCIVIDFTYDLFWNEGGCEYMEWNCFSPDSIL